MTTVAYFHCFSGVAGDMVLGALLHAGADERAVRSALDGLGVTGWSLDVVPTSRNGIAALHARVRVDEQRGHRSVREVLAIFDGAPLAPRAKARATAVFEALAEVEGGIHGVPAGDVELHEVGSVDAIVDVVGTCVALESLGVDEVRCSAVTVGTGVVRGAHGLLPNPSPAVVALLAKYGVPTVGAAVPVELATPTGTAIVTVLSTGVGGLPAMRPHAVGYGAGTAELPDRPNVVQVVVGKATAPEPFTAPGQPVVQVEANVDDATGEVLAHTVAALLAAGAHDAWVTPIVMKKGRPAHTVTALADPGLVSGVAEVLARETGSLGLRATTLERWPLARSEQIVDVDGHRIRVKMSDDRVKVEHDDAAAAARALGRPLRSVLVEAESLATRARRRASS